MASQTYSRASQCDGKRPFTRKAWAKAAAKNSEQSLGWMKAYRCIWCGHWHLGHPVNAEHKRPAAS